jgi:hypothetical protein
MSKMLSYNSVIVARRASQMRTYRPKYLSEQRDLVRIAQRSHCRSDPLRIVSLNLRILDDASQERPAATVYVRSQPRALYSKQSTDLIEVFGDLINGALWSGPPHSSRLWRWLVRFMNGGRGCRATLWLGTDADRLSAICQRLGDLLRRPLSLPGTGLDVATSARRRIPAAGPTFATHNFAGASERPLSCAQS